MLIYLFKAPGDGGIGSKMQVGLMKILIATKQTLLTELRGFVWGILVLNVISEKHQ